ncbi:MAG TPA: hypothetical protein VEC37_05335 [Bacillota bacterium]|nr:hypothetical protein [Bacillota bacterium]
MYIVYNYNYLPSKIAGLWIKKGSRIIATISKEVDVNDIIKKIKSDVAVGQTEGAYYRLPTPA